MTPPQPNAPQFSAAERAAVYRAIAERRDIRSYRPDPVPEQLLWKVLAAGHQAPSVGMMQPWNFVVIRDTTVRRELYNHFLEVNQRAGKQYDNDRAVSYQALKLQGILDAPLNLLVTCSRSRDQEPVLGRFTMRHMDEYSTCLAVQNIWLAARAEGLGVGWMSLMMPEFVAQLFKLPPDVIPVAYLTLGYPVQFPPTPLLERTGWSKKLPLSEVVFDNCFGQPAAPPLSEQPPNTPIEYSKSPEPETAQSRQNNLTKPVGSLGRLEQLAVRLADLQGSNIPKLTSPALLLFAADHGIAEEGVSAYLPLATTEMMYQFVAGGAAVNVLCRQHQVELQLIDVGINHDFRAATGLHHCKVRRGTQNFLHQPAMTSEQLEQALTVGRQQVRNLPNAEVIALGEMGVANTTSSSALFAALVGATASDVVGNGTGVVGSTFLRKQQVVAEGLTRHPDRDPTRLLQNLGGLEIAALVGAIEQAALDRKLIILDGFITCVAALLATARRPEVSRVLVASHLGAEHAHGQVLSALKLTPMLHLDLRLGEGSGAVMGVSLVQSAVRLLREMRTYEESNLTAALNPRNRADAPGSPIQ